VDAEIDISNVLFICTANKVGNIIQPLLDRMEKINVDGYSGPEKKEILNIFLLPKALEENGIQQYPIKFTDDAIRFLVDSYNREPGVRSLEQAINKVCQKIAWKVAN
jgi:ATP-dependent Lon protease